MAAPRFIVVSLNEQGNPQGRVDTASSRKEAEGLAIGKVTSDPTRKYVVYRSLVSYSAIFTVEPTDESRE